ncbi:hypothetical protein T440DRAFT_536333 [Plenodomus tracheiphilus IPT5]|uniref:Uncharacterized protein n=1 Tax=Plenodomus tracheiphilus IPT5 TaxID=1408161 RepID=A0A6A7AZP5_9PLEO|nr:hypothetical protein T440DRAFT_536333 [Plenodomus tracheiphilus IPT5]
MSGTPNTYGTPRHGRVSSRSGVQSISPSQGGGPRGEQFPGHQPTPTVTYGRDDVPSDLQRWNGQSMIPFLRWGFTVRDERGNAHPNYSFDPDVNNAIRLSETIDDFDRDPRLVHELILRIANPDLGHPSMEWIRANRSLVEIFLYRHHKFHGGLVLPPMAPAVQVLRNYEVAVAQARQQGIVFEDDRYPRIAFPPWLVSYPAYECT